MANVKAQRFRRNPYSVGMTEAQAKIIEDYAKRHGWATTAFIRRATVDTLMRLSVYDPDKDPDNDEYFFPLTKE